MGSTTFNETLDLHDNNALITALKNDSIEAFELVYRSYFKGLCAFCSQYVIYSETEEIVQDTMLWLWENRSSLIVGLNLKTLLFTIVKNKALNRIDHYQVRRRVHQEIAEKYEKEFDDPDFYLENEMFSLYKRALESLPAKFREAYELNRKERLSHKEIAVRLNVSAPTVNYRIVQALKLLRLALKDYLPYLILFFDFSIYKKFLCSVFCNL